MPTRKLSDIVVGNRVRKTFDIDGLAKSIASRGLLQPVGIRPDNTLVCGERRLRAVKSLRWTEIPVHVCKDLEDELAFLEAERDENTEREPLTPDEAHELAKRLEPKYKKLADDRAKEGRKKGGKAGGGDRKSAAAKAEPKNDSPSNKRKADSAAETRNRAAKSTGLSAATLAKVDEIKTAAKADPEFRDLCRALMPEERSLLEASIDADGCRDAIVTWANNDGTILDGHNRYEICTQLDKQFKTKAIVLPDRQSCIEWIISNQLGKRNLTESEKDFLRGKRYRAEKKAEGRQPKLAQSEQVKGTTAGRLAEEYNTSPATIRRNADFADAVDTIATTVGRDAKTEILSETSGLTRKQIQAVAAAPPTEQARAYEKAKGACHVSKNTGVPEWYTPDEYLNAARAVLGEIDLDPASSELAQQRVQAVRFYTMGSDGLTKKWKGRIWLNPPYTAGLVDKFLSKLLDQIEAGTVTEAIVLVNNATDTAWLQSAARAASAVCFPKGRIKFLDEEGKPGAPLQGQCLLYFGSAADKFVSEFDGFGFCAEVCA